MRISVSFDEHAKDYSVQSDAVKWVQVDWPPENPTHQVRLEHLPDNNELVILVNDGSGDEQPECIWSSCS